MWNSLNANTGKPTGPTYSHIVKDRCLYRTNLHYQAHSPERTAPPRDYHLLGTVKLLGRFKIVALHKLYTFQYVFTVSLIPVILHGLHKFCLHCLSGPFYIFRASWAAFGKYFSNISSSFSTLMMAPKLDVIVRNPDVNGRLSTHCKHSTCLDSSSVSR
jgi:hypothetical protein